MFFLSVTVLLGALWSSFKQIKDPFLFDWENAIALHAMQGNRATSRSEGKVSWVFSSCGRILWYILELRRGCPFKAGVCSVRSGNLSTYDRHLWNLNWAWQDNMDASGLEAGGRASLISWDIFIGIPINFHEELGIFTF